MSEDDNTLKFLQKKDHCFSCVCVLKVKEKIGVGFVVYNFHWDEGYVWNIFPCVAREG